MKITILIPVFNEEKTIGQILSMVLQETASFETEIIVVNDGSTDKTLERIQAYLSDIVLVNLSENQGKGVALQQGLKKATGDIVIIQDGDLEYDPKDYSRLLKPILKGETKIVYGSRNLGKNKYIYRSFFLGGLVLTKLINFLFKANLTDVSTGYKVFETKTLREIGIESRSFEVEEELTVKILKKDLKIVEIPITYKPRSFEEGKKMNWSDGLRAIWAIFYFTYLKK